MTKILAFSGSSDSISINQKLVRLAASHLDPSIVTVIDIRDFPMPMFSVDMEEADGFPENALKLREVFSQHQGFLISMAEYNGLPPAIFKNAIDWISRMEGKIFQNKPLLLLSTSPGQRGGLTVLTTLAALLPHWGANVVATLCVPGFQDEYDEENLKLNSSHLYEELTTALRQLEKAVG